MPTNTFLNLPRNKRDLIFRQALAEFARYPFERASLSAIVQKAGIAKGSMYQYFANKKALYKFVVGEVYQKKRDFLKTVWLEKEALDFFGLASLYYRRSWRFARQYPLYHQVTVNFWESKDGAIRDEILQKKETRLAEFSDLLDLGLQSGVISPEMDKEAIWFVYHSVAKALIDGFLNADINVDTHEDYIESVLAVLELGLRPREEY